MGKRSRKKFRQGRGSATVDDLIQLALQVHRIDRTQFTKLTDELRMRGDSATQAVADRMGASLDALWDHGWTPADVVHVVGRRLSSTHTEAVTDALIVDGKRQTDSGRTLHPMWQEQLAALETNAGLVRMAADVRVMLEALFVMMYMRPITRTMPRPSAEMHVTLNTKGLDARMLHRVRALLAKAESTEFDEEAEALTAKAQELIARHAIADAVLHADEAQDTMREPSVRRIHLHDPYLAAKVALVAQVGDANRCRTVHVSDYGWATVFGFDHDLDAVELLTTSLLVQATSAMARHGSVTDASGRSTTRSFRRAFLYGFAQRIGERLRQTNAQQMAAAKPADQERALPVLAARDDRVQRAQAAAFPRVKQRRSSISNGGGWSAGRAAADQADLTVAAGALRNRAD